MLFLFQFLITILHYILTMAKHQVKSQDDDIETGEATTDAPSHLGEINKTGPNYRNVSARRYRHHCHIINVIADRVAWDDCVDDEDPNRLGRPRRPFDLRIGRYDTGCPTHLCSGGYRNMDKLDKLHGWCFQAEASRSVWN